MQNSTENFQTVLLIPQNEWFSLNERLKLLEQSTKITNKDTETSIDDFNVILKYDKASEFLGIDQRSLVRAGNQGRIKRLKSGGAGYSYRLSELKRYKDQKGRKKEIQ